jgi:hypothetical protein
MKKDNDEIDHGKIAFQARSSCLPSGIPNMFLPGNPLIILQTPKEVLMIKEGGAEVRHVYLGMPHSGALKPSWYGESVGHYEGDTLVVDTIGQNDRSFVDGYRTPHTTQLHVIERYRVVNGGKGLDVSFTVDDPGTFYKPWSARRPRYLVTDRPLNEEDTICSAGNDDRFNLGFDPVPTADQPDF